jgi:iron-sulfur cluster assembly accessory protein
MTSIRVTQNAWRKMRDILLKSNNNLGFIYSASSGGCNGYNFELNIIQEKEYEKIIKQKFYSVLTDEIKETKEIPTNVYVDPISEMILLGTTIDYIQEDYSKGQFESKFNFEINKELMTSCGCGISFSPKKVNI